jgi:hypothetical protein
MKKRIFILFLVLCLFPIGLYSKEHDVVYLDGYPYLRTEEGDEIDLEIGDRVRVKQTIITGEDERVELESDGYKVVISENTVFSLLEMEIKGKKTNVLSCALGKLSFTKKKFLGTEPRLMTSSVICGVRGTEVTLMAGVDGSSMIIVDDGLVEVLAAGKSLELGKNEGVEVETGAAPGEKFSALEKKIDFSTWNDSRLGSFLENPVRTAANIEQQIDSFIAEMEKIEPLYLESKAKLDAQRKILREKKEKKESVEDFYKEIVQPLEIEATHYILNLRYYSLSGLSLRRYVLSRMYLKLKSRYINKLKDPVYIDFLNIHRRILTKFENTIALPYLVKADI